MFLHVSVILFTGGAIPAGIAGGIPACLAAGIQGGAIPAYIAGGIPACLAAGLGGGVCFRGMPGRDPPPRDDYCCGRYASYWNAFLFTKGNDKLRDPLEGTWDQAARLEVT